MQATNKAYGEKSMLECFLHIYKNEGMKGLWRGVVPTAQRAAVCVGVEVPVYDMTKKHLLLSNMVGDNVLNHLM